MNIVYETKYQLIHEHEDSVNDIGFVSFTFDTIEQALAFCDTAWFKENERVVSDYKWERQNGGERYETPITKRVAGEEYQNTLVICQVWHNPRVVTGSK